MQLRWLAQIRDVGEIIAQNIIDFFADKDNLKEIDKLLKHGIEIKTMTNSNEKTALTDKTFVLTGTLPSLTRDEATKLIEKAGGRTSSSVSKNTDYVLAGEQAGTKLDKAKELGITIIDEEQFRKMLK